MNDPMKQYNELQQAIAQHTLDDPGFREELLADPKGTLEKYLQQPFPVNYDVQVHEVDYDSLHLVIPRQHTASEIAQLGLSEAQLDDMELSDEQLEAVSGGEAVSVIILTIAISSMVTATSIVTSNDQTRQRFGW